MAGEAQLGPFRLLNEVGRGGMGAVYRAVHEEQGVDVAVKVISARHAGDTGYRDAFRREVRAVASLDHPGVVAVLDQGEVPEEAALRDERLVAGSPYLVMELLPRGSIRDRRPRTWAALRRLLLELLDALAHAHARGVVHRDLKPGNVMLAPEGSTTTVRLTDFGIAHLADDAETPGLTSLTGTPHYMAPEQVEGRVRDTGPWTDLYALGCLAYRLAGGRPPFFEPGIDTGEVLTRHLIAPVPPLRSQLPVPPGFDAWLATMLAKQTHERYRFAADAALALDELPDPDGPGEDVADAGPDEADTLPGGAPTLFTVALRTGTGPSRGRSASPASADTETMTAGDLQAGSTIANAPAESTEATEARPHPRARRGAALGPRARRIVEDDAGGRVPMRLRGAGLGLYGLRPVPLVDRDTEREVLGQTLLRAATELHPRAIVLRGPAGVGKSRLCRWLCLRAAEVGAAEVLTATHGARPGPADGLGPMLARHLRTSGLDRKAAVARTLAVMRRLGGSVEDAVATAELTHPAPAQSDADGTPRVRLADRRERTLAAIRFLALLGRERPVLLWLDDVQWGADAVALALGLLSRDRPLPALCVLTARDEALSGRPEEAHLLGELTAREASAVISLGPLTAHDHGELIGGLLGLSGELAAHVADRTAGNPLFAVQLVGDLVARGALRAGTAGFELVPGADTSLPDGIHMLWLRRIAAVAGDGPTERRLALELAATLGRTVDLTDLARVCAAAGVALDPDLPPELELRGLATLADDNLSFAHGMLVESLVRDADQAGRLRAHHRACVRLAQELRERGQPHGAERLAHHLEGAGDLSGAEQALLDAAEERFRTSDYGLALALLDHRSTVLDALGAGPDDRRRVEGDMRRALVLARQGRPGEAEPLVERVSSAAEAHGWHDLLAEALHGRAKNAQMRGQAIESVRLFEEARARYEDAGDVLGIARCEHGIAEMYKQSGRHDEAAELYEGALVHYEEAADTFGHTSCMVGYSDVLLTRDRPRAQAMLEAARAGFEATGYRLGLAIVHLTLGIAARYDSDLERAEREVKRCAEILEAIESTDAVVPYNHLGILALMRDDYAEATARFEENLRRMERDGRRGYTAFVHIELLPCRARAGDFEAFDRHLAEAETSLEESGLADTDLAWLLARAAELAEEAGHPERARRARRLERAQRARLASRS